MVQRLPATVLNVIR